jgi:phosphoglycerate dehydrogenase-like enzyme
MIEIVVDAKLAAIYRDRIDAAADGRARVLSVRGGAPDDPDLSRAEVVVSGWYHDASVAFSDILAAMPSLRWIHSTGAGIDDFVTRELVERRVWVTNVAGAYAPAMAEYALAGMVMLARGLPAVLEAQRKHDWLTREAPRGTDLHGKQLGIVGYGAVGHHATVAAKALGMRVWATRRTPMFVSGEPLDRLLPPEELPALLAASDYVLVAASLNTTTRHLIGERELRAMKPSAVLVNIARGGLVDQDALAAALQAGRLGGAVLDVTTPEPLPPESELWDAANVVITPHVSGDTAEGWERGIEFFCANLRLYLGGQPERMGNLVDLAAHL